MVINLQDFSLILGKRRKVIDGCFVVYCCFIFAIVIKMYLKNSKSYRFFKVVFLPLLFTNINYDTD